MFNVHFVTTNSEADPGFPIRGGAEPLGGTDFRCGHFLVKMCAIMKELDPIGGTHAGGAPWIRQCNYSCGSVN